MAPPLSHADLPALTAVLLPYTAFYYYTSLHTSSPLPVPFSHADIGALVNHPSLPPPLPNPTKEVPGMLNTLSASYAAMDMFRADFSDVELYGIDDPIIKETIAAMDDLTTITTAQLETMSGFTAITIAHASGNDPELTAVNFSGFKQAKTITIGSHCFRHATRVMIKGMPLLERVEIGANSFRNTNSTYGDTNEDFGGEYQDYNPRKEFCLLSCPKVKALVLGNGALIDAGICTIKNVPALEEIVMGDMDNTHPCGCFESGSLELRGCVEVRI